MISDNFFVENRARLLSGLEACSVVVMTASEPRHRSEDSLYRFSVNRNYYYLTGLMEARGILLLLKTQDSWTEYIFTERPEPRKIMYRGEMDTTETISTKTSISQSFYTDQFYEVFWRIMFTHKPKNVYADIQSHSFDFTTPNAMLSRITRQYPHLQTRNIRDVLCNMRRIKTDDEVANLRIAAEATVAGVERMISAIRPGAHTYELRAEFEYHLTKHNMENSFIPVITTGPNILALHYEKEDVLRDGEMVLIDLGAEYELYGVDICRVYPVNGKFTDEQRYWYEAVREAEEAIIQNLRPGLDMREISEIGDKHLARYLKKKGLIQSDSEIRRYLDHGIYHFIGLDAHDVGDICTLEPNMTLAVEPALYIKELGIGIRLEDSILITPNGADVLTSNLEK